MPTLLEEYQELLQLVNEAKGKMKPQFIPAIEAKLKQIGDDIGYVAPKLKSTTENNANTNLTIGDLKKAALPLIKAAKKIEDPKRDDPADYLISDGKMLCVVNQSGTVITREWNSNWEFSIKWEKLEKVFAAFDSKDKISSIKYGDLIGTRHMQQTDLFIDRNGKQSKYSFPSLSIDDVHDLIQDLKGRDFNCGEKVNVADYMPIFNSLVKLPQKFWNRSIGNPTYQNFYIGNHFLFLDPQVCISDLDYDFDINNFWGSLDKKNVGSLIPFENHDPMYACFNNDTFLCEIPKEEIFIVLNKVDNRVKHIDGLLKVLKNFKPGKYINSFKLSEIKRALQSFGNEMIYFNYTNKLELFTKDDDGNIEKTISINALKTTNSTTESISGSFDKINLIAIIHSFSNSDTINISMTENPSNVLIFSNDKFKALFAFIKPK